MPPASLSDEQYCLWRNDKNLQNSFPWIEKGDPHHSSQAFTFHDKWAEWEKDHPEVIQKAKDLLAAEKGTPSAPAQAPAMPPGAPVPMAQPVDPQGYDINIKALTDAILTLSKAIIQLCPTKEALKENPLVQKLIEEAIKEYEDIHAYDNMGEGA